MPHPLPPYARLLGLSVRCESDEVIWTMPFADEVIGRPGFLHGGAIAGLLEFAALGALHEALGDEAALRIKPINVTIAYLRGGTDQETYAAARIGRIGNRIAQVEAQAWQADRLAPIASAQINALLRRD